MKTKIPMLAMLGLLAMAASCKKDVEKQEDRPLSAGLLVVECPTTDPESRPIVTLPQIISSNMTLNNDTIYQMNGLVYVTTPGGSPTTVLTIQQGTIIRGTAGVTNVTPGGGLVITQGARINAQGTEECPIVFTSYRQFDNPESGDWSGVVILGRAPINTATASGPGITATIEGIPSNPPASALYGGSTPNDTSGTMKYVRIEYPGFELSDNNEINGLTLGGVGCGTVIEHVEVYKSNDDAFEFFGGTVNVRYLVSVDALDDMFDFDNGYVGNIQYALGLSDTSRADFSESNGIETDNNSAGNGNTPQTYASISNMTIIGVANAVKANNLTMPPSGTGKYGRGAHIRRNAGIKICKSIFLGLPRGIHLDGTASQGKYTSGITTFSNVWAHSWNAGNRITGFSSSPDFFACNDTIPSIATFGLNNPFNRQDVNFALPASNSPLLSLECVTACSANSNCGFTFFSESFRGAFNDTDNWAQDIFLGGWVRYYED